MQSIIIFLQVLEHNQHRFHDNSSFFRFPLRIRFTYTRSYLAYWQYDRRISIRIPAAVSAERCHLLRQIWPTFFPILAGFFVGWKCQIVRCAVEQFTYDVFPRKGRARLLLSSNFICSRYVSLAYVYLNYHLFSGCRPFLQRRPR